MNDPYTQIGRQIGDFVSIGLSEWFPQIVDFGIGVNFRRDPKQGLKFLITFEQEISEEARKEIPQLIVDRFFEMEVVGKIELL